jgi:bacterioferritin-associated ferredoxin
MAVCKCVCFDVPFSRINERIAEGCSLPQVQRETFFGAKCSMCVPYVIRAVQTHQSVLPVMWAEDFQACGIDPGKVGLIEAMVPMPERVPAGTYQPDDVEGPVDEPKAESKLESSPEKKRSRTKSQK